jgi:hypothetical protein
VNNISDNELAELHRSAALFDSFGVVSYRAPMMVAVFGELMRLREIVAKLHLTEDGQPITPAMTVFVSSGWGVFEMTTLTRRSWDGKYPCVELQVNGEGSSAITSFDTNRIFSTRELAEAAESAALASQQEGAVQR